MEQVCLISITTMLNNILKTVIWSHRNLVAYVLFEATHLGQKKNFYFGSCYALEEATQTKMTGKNLFSAIEWVKIASANIKMDFQNGLFLTHQVMSLRDVKEDASERKEKLVGKRPGVTMKLEDACKVDI